MNEALQRVLAAPLDPGGRLFWGWLLGAFALAAAVWVAGERRRHEQGFLSWLFAPRLWLHPSTFVDLQVGVARLALAPGRWFAGWVGVAMAAHGVALALDLTVGPRPLAEITPVMAGLYALALLLANDLAMYLNHRLHHAVPVLWRFHALHHSAEVLTPLTSLLHHPVYDVSRMLLRAAIAGPLMGVVAWLWTGAALPLQILGVNALRVAFLASTSNLRHSHVPLRFGPILGRVFSSPSQHHLHHSRAPADHNCNYGVIFALWDAALGTLKLPQSGESWAFGLDGEVPHRNLVDAWLRPFAEARRLLSSR